MDSDGQIGRARRSRSRPARVVTDLTGPARLRLPHLHDPARPGPAAGVSGGLTGAIPVPDAGAGPVHRGVVQHGALLRHGERPGDSPTSVLTATAFANRLNKASLAIRNVLRDAGHPRRRGGGEPHDAAGAGRPRSTPTRSPPGSRTRTTPAYLEEGNDIGGIDVGFLVKSTRVNVVDVTQYGKDDDLHRSEHGRARAPERPARRSSCGRRSSRRPGSPTRSPSSSTTCARSSGVDDPVDGNRVRDQAPRAGGVPGQPDPGAAGGRPRRAHRLGRRLQRLPVQRRLRGLDRHDQRDADPVRPGRAVLRRPRATPTSSTSSTPCPAAERYSYSFDGNAQVLDHELVTQNLLPRFDGSPLRAQRRGLRRVVPQRPQPSRAPLRPRHSGRLLPAAAASLRPSRRRRSGSGLKNSDDVGIRFDLRAEVYYNGTTLVGSGELASAIGGSSGFNNAKLDSIPLSLPAAVGVAPGDTLSIKLLVRNACSGSGKNSGTARLWFNDAAADSRFDATIDAQNGDNYLLDGGALGTLGGRGTEEDHRRLRRRQVQRVQTVRDLDPDDQLRPSFRGGGPCGPPPSFFFLPKSSGTVEPEI